MIIIEPPKKISHDLSNFDNEELKKLYKMMVLIRKTELRIENEYSKDQIRTPIHLYIGQEAIATGVCSVLNKNDYVFSNHRGHGHFLAKGGNLHAFIAELYGKENGCSKGRGGSMHLNDSSVNLMGSSSIVGGGIPLAVGAALSSQMQKNNRISVVFFGNGALDQGVLYESINFSLLKKLPILFVCENNFYAICSPEKNLHIDKNISNRFIGMGISAMQVDGTDVLQVYKTSQKIVKNIRNGSGPYFLECKAYRWRGHIGCGSDTNLGYRNEEELEAWIKACPINYLKKLLIKSKKFTNKKLTEMDNKIEQLIDNAFLQAQQANEPKPDSIFDYLYS